MKLRVNREEVIALMLLEITIEQDDRQQVQEMQYTVDYEDIRDITTNNARKLFKISYETIKFTKNLLLLLRNEV